MKWNPVVPFHEAFFFFYENHLIRANTGKVPIINSLAGYKETFLFGGEA